MEWKTDDMTEQFDGADIAGNKAAAAFSYLGALVLVPLFATKNSKFARFHANQGLSLLLTGVAYNIAVGIFAAVLFGVSWRFYPVVQVTRLTGLAFPIFAVMGICNAVNGKARELPVIGKMRLLR